MDEPTLRTWCRPELIALMRSGPEEVVLASCKMAGDVRSPYTNADYCSTLGCPACEGLTAS